MAHLFFVQSFIVHCSKASLGSLQSLSPALAREAVYARDNHILAGQEEDLW
jgi:hypothetical protein